jgi:hypothetical protein
MLNDLSANIGVPVGTAQKAVPAIRDTAGADSPLVSAVADDYDAFWTAQARTLNGVDA